MEDKKWYGVDLDGTLAKYAGWNDVIGPPIPEMVERVKAMIAAGKTVKIFTARGTGGNFKHQMIQNERIKEWCGTHIGAQLEITNSKDIYMEALYDDRAVAVEFNTGRLLSSELQDRPYKLGK